MFHIERVSIIVSHDRKELKKKRMEKGKKKKKKAQKSRKASHKPRSEVNEFSLLDSFAHQTSGGFVDLLWPECTMRPVPQ